MLIKGVNYSHGGLAIELVAEGEIEYAMLRQIWEHGEMQRGNGNSISPNGGSTGFYLQCEKRRETRVNVRESKNGKT